MISKVQFGKLVIAAAAMVAVSGCAKDGAIDVSSGVGVSVTRTGCPAIAIPDNTGDITLFNPANSTDASAIDVVAQMSKLRATCNGEGDKIYTEASFEVTATRYRTDGPQTVTIPYFSTIVQGGTAVVAKRVSTVTLNFAAGEYRASTTGKAGSFIDAAAARLPEDVVEKITRKRKPGDPDAALDPLDDPEVRTAVSRSTFELLVGFQLTPAQLQYNATR